MSEWFVGEKRITKKRLIPYIEIWHCPELGCEGKMVYTGQVWPTVNPGYHHKCDKCQVVYATHSGQFPRMVTEPEEQDA